ncbi:MAG: TolC family protein [Balneolaceae bacterium]
MKRDISFLVFLLISTVGFTQENPVTLEYCYEQIADYPLANKTAIQKKIINLNRQIAQSGWYPDIQLSASTSYQSDVTSVPFAAPGTSPPTFSKDHYNISVDINQTIFEGGRIGSLKNLKTKTGKAEIAAIEGELLQIRSQVEQVYFGILYMQKKKESVELLIQDMKEQLSSVDSRVRNGVLLPGNALVLRAEILKAGQQLPQISHDIESGYDVLGELIGEKVSSAEELVLPDLKDFEPDQKNEIIRPEFEAFNARIESLESQIKITEADRFPTLAVFGKAAYGRPGLNAFDDDLQEYWLIGMKAQWNFKSWSNAGKKAEVIALQQKNVKADEEAFNRQLNATLKQAEQQIEMLREQIEHDEEILALRSDIVKEKENLLNQGIITSTEYITELNAEHQAQLDLEQHRIQLVQANIDYLTKKGISWN